MLEIPEIRSATKGIINTTDGLLLFAVSKRGSLNLIGGGNEPGETNEQAFLREAQEEAGIEKAMLSDLKEAIPDLMYGVTTSKDNVTRIGKWKLLEANLTVPISQLTIPETSEIAGITALTLSESLNHPQMLGLARQSLIMVFSRSK